MNIDTMSLTTLRREYHRIFGLRTTSKRKRYLQQRIATRLAELARERRPCAAGPRDRRLPPSDTVLTREHDGKIHRVRITEVGFEYRRRTFASLSAVARAITGTNWNGYGFFGLTSSAADGSAS